MVNFSFESTYDVFDVRHRATFLDSKFPACVCDTLNFSKCRLLSPLFVDVAGGGKLSGPLFHFNE